jgi:hypothetical protein
MILINIDTLLSYENMNMNTNQTNMNNIILINNEESPHSRSDRRLNEDE